MDGDWYIVILCPQTVFSCISNHCFDSCLSPNATCGNGRCSYQWFFSHILAVLYCYLTFIFAHWEIDAMGLFVAVSIVCTLLLAKLTKGTPCQRMWCKWRRCKLFSFQSTIFKQIKLCEVKETGALTLCLWSFAPHTKHVISCLWSLRIRELNVTRASWTAKCMDEIEYSQITCVFFIRIFVWTNNLLCMQSVWFRTRTSFASASIPACSESNNEIMLRFRRHRCLLHR